MTKKRTRKRTPKKATAADIFDFSQGEIRSATVEGHAITYRVPEGTAIVGLHLSAARLQDDNTALAQKYAEFVAEHLQTWPWDVEISPKSIAAMMRKSSELFWALSEAIEKAGGQLKN